MSGPARSSVFWGGTEITGRPVYENVRQGLGFVPEDRRIFAELTVAENLEVARLPAPEGYEPWTESRIFECFVYPGEQFLFVVNR